MKIKKYVMLLLVLMLILTSTACGGTAAPAATSEAPAASAEAPVQSSAPAPSVAAAGDATEIEEITDADTTGYELKPGDWAIGLSNSYYGNTWRKQMVDNFNETAEEAKAEGLLGSYEVQNGDNTVNAQLSQMNSFILKGVDAICVNAVSPTALNSVIKKAYDAGIKVIAFDSTVTSPYAYTIDFDFISYGEGAVDSVAKIAGEKSKVIIVRGVSGSAPDEQMYAGNLIALERYPDMEVVATVNGEASATKAQEEITKILPSLTQVDGVVTQGGGDAYGVAQAFEQSTLKTPVIIGDNSAEFIQWWLQKKASEGYETASQGSTPSISSAALWVSLYILNGCEVPTKMMCQYYKTDQSNVEEFADLTPGTIVSPSFTREYVVEKVIKPYILK
ncbi:MAG: ABC transporter substrate-binding protein [Christensenellales bacterium]